MLKNRRSDAQAKIQKILTCYRRRKLIPHRCKTFLFSIKSYCKAGFDCKYKVVIKNRKNSRNYVSKCLFEGNCNQKTFEPVYENEKEVKNDV